MFRSSAVAIMMTCANASMIPGGLGDDADNDDDTQFPPWVRKQTVWAELQQKVDGSAKKRSPPSERAHFCNLCAYVYTVKNHADKHIRNMHSELDIDAAEIDQYTTPLKSIPKYYRYVTKMMKMRKNDVSTKASEFIAKVDFAIDSYKIRNDLPKRVQNLNSWKKMQQRIDTAPRKGANGPHFCPVCGIIAGTRSDIVKHALKTSYFDTHGKLEPADVPPLVDVALYYVAVEDMEHIHMWPAHFVKTGNYLNKKLYQKLKNN